MFRGPLASYQSGLPDRSISMSLLQMSVELDHCIEIGIFLYQPNHSLLWARPRQRTQ